MTRFSLLFWVLLLHFVSGCAPRAILLKKTETQNEINNLEQKILPIPYLKAEGRIYYSRGESNYLGNFFLIRDSHKLTLLISGPLGISDTKIVLTEDSVKVYKSGEETSLGTDAIEEMVPLFSLLSMENFPSVQNARATRAGGAVVLEFSTDSLFVTATLKEGVPKKISFKDRNSSLILSNFKVLGEKYIPTTIFIEREKESLEVKIKKVDVLTQRKGGG